MAGERIYRWVGEVLTEIAARDPLRRYRMSDVAGAAAYVELTDAEEAARDAEEALPPPPFSGLGRAVLLRPAQLVPSDLLTAITFALAESDTARFFDPGQGDRLVIPAQQAGLFAATAHARFSDPGGNVGDRALYLDFGAGRLTGSRQRVAEQGQTELSVSTEIELAAGDPVRLLALQTSGDPMEVRARLTLRRL